MLADFGAEVIKVEQPGSGDYWRWMPPKVRTHGAQFLALNRGKKSIALDLKTAGGREVLLKLCEGADMLIEGFRPGVMDRLGLGPQVLHTRNPRLVVCALTGFGQDGPWSQMAAHDLNYVGITGLMLLVNGRHENPGASGLPIGDIGAGSLMAVAGMLAALVDAQRTGRGRFVDVSVADGLLSWIGFITSRWNAPGEPLDDNPFDAPFDKPFYTVYETRDGRHFVVGAYEDKFWRTLCRVLDLPQWADRQWCEGQEEKDLRAAVGAVFRTRDFEDWRVIFEANEACVTPVLSTREALESEHARARGMIVTVDDPREGRLKHVGNPIRFDAQSYNSLEPVPELGADSEAILAQAGYDAPAIAELRRHGAL
jgi:crotonobetainyl-CoA:carnitine CoA-transferase CaiB-like acyl-CoA transferase